MPQHQGEAMLCLFVFTSAMEFKGIIFVMHLWFIKMYKTNYSTEWLQIILKFVTYS